MVAKIFRFNLADNDNHIITEISENDKKSGFIELKVKQA